MQPLELTRKAMYDLVWSKPMTKVAAEFGISDVALKKTCDRHRVPTPPRGYWAKKDAGKPVKQVRFVEAAEPQDEVIVIYRSNQQQLPETLRAIIEKDRAARAVRPKSLNSTLPKARALGEIHKSVVATAKALRAAKPDKNTAVSAIGDGHKSMSIAADGGTVVFKLIEKVIREKHIPTIDELAAEKRRQAKSQWGWSFERAYPGWDFIRTGEFSFEIENQYLDGFRRSWRDGKQQRLEDLIEDISIGLVAYAAGAKLRREEWEKRERNWERQSRVRARAEQRQRREEDRAKILDELVAVSDEASKLRRWLSEAEKRARPEKPNEFTQFVVWAKERPAYLEHCVNAEGIAETLKSRDLFPETDPLVDPPDDLVEE